MPSPGPTRGSIVAASLTRVAFVALSAVAFMASSFLEWQMPARREARQEAQEKREEGWSQERPDPL
jgi:hypothetical protein